MARLIDRFITPASTGETRSEASSVTMFGGAEPEWKLTDYKSYVQHGYAGNGPIWSLIQTRAQALSEIEFRYQDLESLELLGRVPLLDVPWEGGSAGDLETAIEVDVSLDGNAFVYRAPGSDSLDLLRPDRVDIVGDFISPVSYRRLGYLYFPNGRQDEGIRLNLQDVAHIAPMPDPLTMFRGQSWIRAIAQEGDADSLMTKHKGKFFTNGATATLAVTAESNLTESQRKALKSQFQAKQAGWQNAYKTIFLEGGADVKVVGSGLEQISFSQVQGKGETRLAAAAQVPPIVAGFSEGLQSGTYSNYSQAVRKFIDFFCRPRWRQDCESLSALVGVPAGQRLWYDDRRISFLQQDAKDAAAIRKEDALTIESLIRGGFTPDSAKEAVTSGRYEGLEHTGLVSVQLQPPGTSVSTGSQDSGTVTDDGEPQ